MGMVFEIMAHHISTSRNNEFCNNVENSKEDKITIQTTEELTDR